MNEQSVFLPHANDGSEGHHRFHTVGWVKNADRDSDAAGCAQTVDASLTPAAAAHRELDQRSAISATSP